MKAKIEILIEFNSNTVDDPAEVVRNACQNIEWAIGNGALTAGKDEVEIDSYDVRSSREEASNE